MSASCQKRPNAAQQSTSLFDQLIGAQQERFGDRQSKRFGSCKSRQMGLLTTASVAIDGSKFKAVNTRDKNFTRGKVERRRAQLEKSVARYLAQLDTADLQEPFEELAAKTAHLKEKLVKLESEMQRLAAMEKLMLASPAQQISLTDPDSRSMATSGRGSGVVGYNVQVAVDTKHHLIVAHAVTNDGSDREIGRAHV